MLARRLTQRGVTLSGGALPAFLVQQASAGVPESVVLSTIKPASVLVAGKAAATGAVSVKVAALTEGVIKAMLFNKRKSAIAVVLMLGLMATGATLLIYRTAAGQDEKKSIAEKPVEPATKKEKDKEAFTAWGKEINGLQAGLGFRPGEHRAYHYDETVTLVVRVRNVGKDTVKFSYLGPFIEHSPTVADSNGKPIPQPKVPPDVGGHIPGKMELAPGKEIELHELKRQLRPARESGSMQPLALYGTGKVAVQYDQVLGPNEARRNWKQDPALSMLATGKLELEIKSDPLATEKRRPQEAKAGVQPQEPTPWEQRLTIKAPKESRQTYNVAISPDGKMIAVCYAFTTKVLDATNGRELVTLSATDKGRPRGLAFSPDGKLIAQTGDDGDVLLYSADSGEVKTTLTTAKPVYGIAFSPDGKTLAAAGYTEVLLLDLASNKVLREFKKTIPAVVFNSDGWAIAFSGDGKKLATSDASNNTAKVWDVETGKELATFGKQPFRVTAVAFSPDGKTLAAANRGEDPQVKLWDLATGKERFTLKGPTGWPNSLAFSPDGKVLAVAGQEDPSPPERANHVVRLWNPATGKQIAELDMHGDRPGFIPSLGFARNGTLVTASDAAVRIWEPGASRVTKKK
jgi:DNA-binding beta-propeller fold protein YncE